MAKLCPSRSSMVVLARRVESPGISSPSTTMETVGSMRLTSGATTRLMRSLPITVGVKARLTPNSLNSTVVTPSSCSTGTGNSPPARNFAVSPDSAIRFGSASVLTKPFCSSVWNVVDRSGLPPVSRLPMAKGIGEIGRPDEVIRLNARSPATARSWPMPSSRTTLRETSANLTCSITCWLPCTLIALVTDLGAYCSAIASASLSELALLTRPLKRMPPLTGLISIISPGITSCSLAFSDSTSYVTARSRTASSCRRGP